MSIKRPDLYEHNNPNNAIVDSNGVRGGSRAVNNLTELYALNTKKDQLKQNVTTVFVVENQLTYRLIDIDKVNTADGWKLDGNPLEVNPTITSSTLTILPTDLTNNIYTNPSLKDRTYTIFIKGGAYLQPELHFQYLPDGGFQLVNGVTLGPTDFLVLTVSSLFNPDPIGIDSLPSVLPTPLIVE